VTQTVFDELDVLPPLVDNELELHLAERTFAVRPAWAPARVLTYRFDICVQGEKVGNATLRAGSNEYLDRYAGQIGYGVDYPHRGKHYAARACRLLFHLARCHGMKQLWITCNPENVASRRTCELVGGEMVDIVDVPEDIDIYREGDRQKCRYRIRL
jgi:tagatose 1,6-diphosphate aldolase